MTMSREERILAFIEGRLEESDRRVFLDDLAADPELAQDVRWAAAGLEAAESLAEAPGAGAAGRETSSGALGTGPRPISPWWVAAAAAAAVALAVPGTLWLTGGGPGGGGEVLPAQASQPVSPDPSFVLVLHGLWPDRAEVGEAETQRRAEEYWGWTTSLAESGQLLAAGDLRWEPGSRLGPSGQVVPVGADEVDQPSFVVGMFAVRAESYDEALAVARDCPHLRYGGSVSVRQVGGGFVTTPGLADWEG